MQKLFSIGLICTLIIPILFVPENIHAQTLGDLKKELDELEQKYEDARQEEEDTKDQIEINNATINQIEKNVKQMEEDVKKLNQEIEQLNKDIKEKDKEIKQIMSFVQISSGESAYLEYAFGAKDFTDFIYRISVSEQLATYNNQLIKDFEKMIQDNKKKQEEMKQKKEDLAKEKERLNQEIVKLGERLEEISFIKMDTDEEIEMQREAIKVLEDMGCKDHEDIKTCGNRLPSDTAFLRPIISGYVTSEYGYRCLPWLNPQCSLHEAIDMSNSNRYVPVYAVANGVVIGTRVRSSCGGNMIFILHTVNGQKYTTEYAHLRTIDVSIGQTVTKNTMIGTMGGDQNTEYWDQCSQQQHLHFGIAKGHYLRDYYSWNTFLANTFDPRKIVNFPFTGGAVDPFDDRYTKY